MQADVRHKTIPITDYIMITIFFICIAFMIASANSGYQTIERRHSAADKEQPSLGLLRSKGVETVMKMLSEEVSDLLKAAGEGDETARTILHELTVQTLPVITLAAKVVALPFLAVIMVQCHSRHLSPPLATPLLLHTL